MKFVEPNEFILAVLLGSKWPSLRRPSFLWDATCAVGRDASVHVRLSSCRRGVLIGDCGAEIGDVVFADEIYGTATEAAAHHARTKYTFLPAGQFNEKVQFLNAYLEIVAQTGV